MKALRNYHRLIYQVDTDSRRIQEGYAGQIACEKGCAGNCCRIHLSVFPIEAISLAIALKKLSREMVRHIRQKAGQANSFGPCPLLEDGACLLYAARLMICRTHGLPMAIEYRGKRSIGFCQKNFRKLDPVPDDAVLDLGWLNNNLAALNQSFINEFPGSIGLRPRLFIGEALLLDL
jgi:Fe-S-cluster containining protein